MPRLFLHVADHTHYGPFSHVGMFWRNQLASLEVPSPHCQHSKLRSLTLSSSPGALVRPRICELAAACVWLLRESHLTSPLVGAPTLWTRPT